MASSAAVTPAWTGGSTEKKDLYDLGEVPPLGHVPKTMYAWVVRKDRHGPPERAHEVEVVPTWAIGDDDVLVYVMAAGLNYNHGWGSLGIGSASCRDSV